MSERTDYREERHGYFYPKFHYKPKNRTFWSWLFLLFFNRFMVKVLGPFLAVVFVIYWIAWLEALRGWLITSGWGNTIDSWAHQAGHVIYIIIRATLP